LAGLGIDNIKVDKLVKEYLAAQSLKILPQTPFGDAVTQYVKNDDKYAMEQFVEDSLSVQVKEILLLEDRDVDEEEDLSSIFDQVRQKQEEMFASGVRKIPRRKGILKPRPSNWDSDLDGEWEDAVGAWESEHDEDSGPETRRGRDAESDEDGSVITTATTGKKAATKKVPAKKAPAKRAPAKSKAAPKAKAAAKAPVRVRKKAAEPSDDEDEDDDVVMLEDSPAPAPVKSQPKRAAATRGRQTQLNFSQPTKSQAPVELSDDEISDDDAFEPMASSRRR